MAREGMSKRENECDGPLSRTTRWGKRNEMTFTLMLHSVVSLGKSTHSGKRRQPLRITSSVGVSFLKRNASSPSCIETSSGKSTPLLSPSTYHFQTQRGSNK